MTAQTTCTFDDGSTVTVRGQIVEIPEYAGTFIVHRGVSRCEDGSALPWQQGFVVTHVESGSPVFVQGRVTKAAAVQFARERLGRL